MKNIFIIALLGFFGISNAQVTFKPGFRGGVNFSHFTKGDNYNNGFYYETDPNYSPNNNRDYSSITDFYLGFYGALKLTKYYTLQPEIDYSRQGSDYSFVANNIIPQSITYNVSYLSIAIVNKFTFNDKFNFHIGPTIDILVEENFDTDSELDLAFLLGLGYNFNKNIGIEARVKKGIIPVLDYSDSNHTNVVFSIGGTYTFDLK